MRNIVGFLAAVLTAYILGAIASTQSVLSNLTEMGVAIDLTTRFEAIGHDLIGLMSVYLPVIAVGFIVAWPVTGLIVKRMPAWRTIGYVLAGFTAVVVAHLILKQLLEVTGIAAARTTYGLIVQGLAGAAGGMIFVRLVPSVDRHPSSNTSG